MAMTPELLALIRVRAHQGTEALAVRDRRALLAYIDDLTGYLADTNDAYLKLIHAYKEKG